MDAYRQCARYADVEYLSMNHCSYVTYGYKLPDIVDMMSEEDSEI